MDEIMPDYDLPEIVEEQTTISVTDSILLSIKKMIGLDRDYDAFDADLIMHINSVFMILNQIGVGSRDSFIISGVDDTWDSFFATCKLTPSLVKSYMYLKVRLLFDPPSTGVLHEAMERQISEFEWRLNVACDELIQNANGGEVNGEDQGDGVS